MKPRRSTEPRVEGETSDLDSGRVPWGFRPDGSFDWHSDRNHLSPCSKYVRQLILTRRHTAISPAEMAAKIATGPFPDLLGSSIRTWTHGSKHDDWPYTRSSTSAGSCIVHEGRDPNSGSWLGASFTSKATP